ncbi:hypothetical protein [Pandoraea oxalativorans]|uniref:DUF2946 domain-containing protein n=1 Tax=Pandoraea oxalativorans TaxID=573737 RepID=A0A192B1D8_9BURK|nr:hypothetical protein [Pandoraea oxalativorans]ANJ87134.1 hypothetical protein MB84_31125 [Pandoraea oxalativorans]
MHRRWLPFWLIVCVLVSQIALARHVVFHTAAALAAASVAAEEPADAQRQSGDVGSSGSNGQRSDDDGVCEQCLAFIAVDVALPALPVFASLPPLREWHYPPVAQMQMRSVLRGPTRNRDPPRPSVSFV